MEEIKHRLGGQVRRLAYLNLLLALAGLMVLGCGNTIKSSKTPDIAADPTQIGFGKIVVGEEADQTVEISNPGEGTLAISKVDLSVGGSTEYDLYWSKTADGANQFAGVVGGQDKFEYPLKIAARESLFFIVNFKPASDHPAEGALIFTTNAPGPAKASFHVPIVAANGAPEINVSPTTYDFGRVEPVDPARGGEPKTTDITVTNTGQLQLLISNITLSGSQEFTPLIDGQDPRRDESGALFHDPDHDGTEGLAPGNSFTITVQYAPATQGPDSAALNIISNDPIRPTVEVSLTANGATPCINVIPGALEFPASLVNRDDSRQVIIESCGGGALNIDGIEMDPDSDDTFEIDATSLPENFPAVLPAASPEQAPPQRPFRVTFKPREERVYHGKILIHTNDPSNEIKVVSLLGRGVLNACPQSRAVMDEFNVQPLDTVALDGTPSVDPDGPNNRPVRYEWVVIERPEGSTAQPAEGYQDPSDPLNTAIPDDSTTPLAHFFADLAGTYQIELRVTDNLGLTSQQCETSSIVTVVAKPEQAIHLQLTWTTPGDPDQTDRQGTDVDLHLLRAGADAWFGSPDDCYYNDPQPNWGDLNATNDDPTLDIDDINGAGPENINLLLPDNTADAGSPYRVGVHYYSSRERLTGSDYGPSTATLRVFIRGMLAGEYPGIELPTQDTFCEVADIDWPSGTVTENRQCQDSRP